VLGDVAGLDVVELGCGTAYFSAWLARLGARPVGVDITPAQLGTARRLMDETGIEFPLVEADAGETGLPDAGFDLALSEYGASIWVDPYRWIPEAARLLRPGGRLVFLRNSTLVTLCSPDDDVAASTTLQRPQFGLHRLAWPDGGVEFQLGHGEWIDILRRNGFEIERLVEIQAPADAATHEYYSYVSVEWARQWPCEEIWVARKR
jgi:SAM-dependent methyltransferase